jgi:hypothetical protein
MEQSLAIALQRSPVLFERSDRVTDAHPDRTAGRAAAEDGRDAVGEAPTPRAPQALLDSRDGGVRALPDHRVSHGIAGRRDCLQHTNVTLRALSYAAASSRTCGSSSRS